MPSVYEDTPHTFELARERRGRVTSATKSNGLNHSMVFWDEVVAAVAAEYPDVAVTSTHVDALTARFVLAPDLLDVVVGSNLFGDILTDLGGAPQGSLGIPASGSINLNRPGSDGDFIALKEDGVHDRYTSSPKFSSLST